MKTIRMAIVASLMLSFKLYAATDINLASQTELEALSGIGPGKAKAIIAYRQQHGGFKSIEELEQVDGIGPATLKKLSRDIKISKKKKDVPSKGRISSSIELD
jgi:competence protein ComEA